MLDTKSVAQALGNVLEPGLRSIRPAGDTDFVPFDRYGEPIEGMSWCPLSIGDDDDLEIYLLRLAPGTQTYPHEHVGCEQFLVLEGSLIDCDGERIPAGTFARFEAGSRHHSSTDEDCLLLVVMRTPNRRLEIDETA